MTSWRLARPSRSTWLTLSCALLLGGGAAPALAVPSFARQTGMACSACHTMVPELTPFGREFKLNGYVLDNLRQIRGETMERRETLALNQLPPISFMAQISYTRTAQSVPEASGALAKDGEVLFPQQVSFFYAGKIANNLGAFVQLTYDGAADHFGLDNTDIRYARYIGNAEPDESGGAGASKGFLQSHDVLVGLTLNNNPTVQDPWNTTPAWGFPYASSSVAPGPNASTLLDDDLGGNVAGLGAYLWFDHAFYAELSGYTAAKVGGNHPLDSSQSAVLSGVSPYWRAGYQFSWNTSSLFLGTYGTQMRIFPGTTPDGVAHPLSGPVDRYTDVAADVQYQYITDDHQVTFLGTYIHEDRHLDASVAYGVSADPTNDLHTIKATAEYSYRRLIGGAVGMFSTSGGPDPLLYANDGTVNGSLAGSPDSRGYILELDYMPFLNTKLQLQYVGYTKFNGAGTDYAGIGRNASDNNTLYMLVWLNF